MGSSYKIVRLENEVVISELYLEWSRDGQNGHVEVTYKTFWKEPYINQFLCH
jgi:hypothetical protein